MGSKGFFAQGTIVQFGSTAIGGLRNLSVDGSERGDVEITDNDSAGDREYVPGLRENGELTLECNYVPTDAGQQALVANRNSATRTIETVTITFPESPGALGSQPVMTFDAYVKATPLDAPMSDESPTTRSFTLKVSGQVQETEISLSV